MSDDGTYWHYLGATPTAPGWYAVLICFDEEEGVFPLAAFWDGDSWGRNAVIAYGSIYADEQSALRAAHEYDPSGP